MTSGQLYRLAAFTNVAEGGNPAGVWIGDALPDPAEMQRIAADVGFSETAFVAPTTGFSRTIRYYSPEMEVPFCGHATIATGVALGQLALEQLALEQLALKQPCGDGTYELATTVGLVPVTVQQRDGQYQAALTSVIPKQQSLSESLLNEILMALHWTIDDLDLQIPPILAYAGSWHGVLALREHDRLNQLDYDFETLKQLMQQADLTTLQLIWPESPLIYHCRNPFPVGGVIEDPATGSAAAALGGYLRDAQLLPVPATLCLYQGAAMGRPSQITVEIPATGGIIVRGQAVWL